jgi:hypothetical protein
LGLTPPISGKSRKRRNIGNTENTESTENRGKKGNIESRGRVAISGSRGAVKNGSTESRSKVAKERSGLIVVRGSKVMRKRRAVKGKMRERKATEETETTEVSVVVTAETTIKINLSNLPLSSMRMISQPFDWY